MTITATASINVRARPATREAALAASAKKCLGRAAPEYLCALSGCPIRPILLGQSREGHHVCNLASHQKLQRVFGACIVAKIDQALVYDLRAGLGGDVAAKIDIQFAGYLEIIRSPGITHRIAKGNAAAARDGDKRIR